MSCGILPKRRPQLYNATAARRVAAERDALRVLPETRPGRFSSDSARVGKASAMNDGIGVVGRALAAVRALLHMSNLQRWSLWRRHSRRAPATR